MYLLNGSLSRSDSARASDRARLICLGKDDNSGTGAAVWAVTWIKVTTDGHHHCGSRTVH